MPLSKSLPQYIRAVAIARFRLNGPALAAVRDLQQMLPALGRQRIGRNVLGAGQNIGRSHQRLNKDVRLAEAVLQIRGQRVRNVAERLQLEVGMAQAVLVVVVEVTDTGAGHRFAGVNGPMIGDRKECGEELADELMEVEFGIAMDEPEICGGW